MSDKIDHASARAVAAVAHWVQAAGADEDTIRSLVWVAIGIIASCEFYDEIPGPADIELRFDRLAAACFPHACKGVTE